MVYRREGEGRGGGVFRGLVLIKPSALRSERQYRYSKSKICQRSIYHSHLDFNNHFSKDIMNYFRRELTVYHLRLASS